MNELLAIIGTSWRPMLLFPGALTALILVLVTSLIWRRTTPERFPRLDGTATVEAASVVLALAFLPVPGSGWRYGLDLLVVLALIEIPHWYALRRRLAAAESRDRAEREIAALLSIAVPFVLALALVAQVRGSMVLGELRGGGGWMWWVGIAGWALALPPLLTLGPWHDVGNDSVITLLRRIAHIGLLVTVALPASVGLDGLAIAAAVAFGTLGALDHLWHGRSEEWERWQPLIAVVLLGVLVYAGATAWYARSH